MGIVYIKSRTKKLDSGDTEKVEQEIEVDSAEEREFHREVH